MIKCEICNREYKSIQPLSKHITAKHNLSKKDYYDRYLKQENEGLCLVCNKETTFRGMDKGYNKYCCQSHQVKNQQQNLSAENRANQKKKVKKRKEQFELDNDCTQVGKVYKQYGRFWINDFPIIEISNNEKYVKNEYISKIAELYNNKKMILRFKPKSKSIIKSKSKHKRGYFLNRQFEQENNCTQIGVLIQKYGQGWLSLDLPKIIRNKNAHFISNKYLLIIEQYASINHNYRSKKEEQLYNEICKYYNSKVIHNSKKVISPLELDIYIPDLKLAIEYNGVKWHCIENDVSNNYHLNKSLMCRKLGIRLVHIYEFESYKEQLQLIKNLILGNDLYPKNDFNKNNLLNFIPEPEIIYKSKHYTIYGAGKLY